MKKNKKEESKRKSFLFYVISTIEIILILVLIVNYLCQAVVYSIRSINYMVNSERYVSYSEIFYDASFKGNSDQENFEYLYNLTSNYDRDLIENHNALNSEIALFAWVALLKRIAIIIIMLALCEVIKIFYQEPPLLREKITSKIIENKKIFIINAIVVLIANSLIAIFTPFEVTIYGTIIFLIIFYALICTIEKLALNNK